MPTHPCGKSDDDTKVIYRDRLDELLREIEAANLSPDAVAAVERKVAEIKDRMKHDTKISRKND